MHDLAAVLIVIATPVLVFFTCAAYFYARDIWEKLGCAKDQAEKQMAQEEGKQLT